MKHPAIAQRPTLKHEPPFITHLKELVEQYALYCYIDDQHNHERK